jgi:hypothetical protein
MSYLNADERLPGPSASLEIPPSMLLRAGIPAPTGRYGPCLLDTPPGTSACSPSGWLLELTDDEDRCVRVLIADDGSDWDAEGDDE